MADYYPFGSILRTAKTNEETHYRYGYQGEFSEEDEETGWNAFELRNYDSKIGKWLSIDPDRQYASPYTSMGNNPINKIDPDGAFTITPPDIILRNSKGEALLTIKSDVLDADLIIESKQIEVLLDLMGSPKDVVVGEKRLIPNVIDIRSFDSQIETGLAVGSLLNGDANTISVGIDATALGGMSFSLDLVQFKQGPDAGNTVLYWTRAVGGGWLQGGDVSVGFINAIGDVNSFDRRAVRGEGYILNAGYGPVAGSTFTNKDFSYMGYLLGIGAGAPGGAGYTTNTELITPVSIRQE